MIALLAMRGDMNKIQVTKVQSSIIIQSIYYIVAEECSIDTIETAYSLTHESSYSDRESPIMYSD